MNTLKKAVCILLTAAIFALGAVSPIFAAGTAQQPEVEDILASMTTEEKVSQLLMPAFRYTIDGEGKTQGMTVLTDEAADMIREYGFAGVILFAQNAGDTAKAVQYVDDAQRANAGHKTQLLVAIDQEGGSVTRLGHGTMMPGNMALGAAGDTALTAEAARIMGEEIMSMGINFDFAPVLDVNSNPANPVIGLRSFSDDPETVAAQGVAFMQALQSTGAISTLKHFPGHGDTATDSHTGLPCIDKSYEELRARELVPFQAAIDAGAEAIMTAHIQYPRIEQTTYVSKLTGEEITLPATLSRTILTDILRGEMGFEGVVITDAMNMDAIDKHFDKYDAAKLAIEAGVDILLMPVNVTTAEGMDELRTYIRTLADMVESGAISKEKVDAAVKRVLTLKADHGLTRPYGGTDAAASAVVGSTEHHEVEWNIAKKAITLVKNENNLLPLTGKNEKVVVLTAYDNEVLSMEYAVGRLREENKLADGMEVTVHSIQRIPAEEAVALTQGADHVILIVELYSAAGLNGDAAKKADAIIDSVHASGGDVSIMSCNLPYDIARYEAADAICVAWSSKGMSEDPRVTDGAAAQYGPNMPAALYLMLSPDETPTGTLPVNIPKLTAEGGYSDEIRYARGFGLKYVQLSDFPDVNADAWYGDSVRYVLRKGIMTGYGDGTFAPESALTRAQLATVLWRMAGEPESESAIPFADGNADAWYAPAIRWATSEAIVSGVSDTVFAPDDPVTREQAATILYRYAKAEAQDTSALAGFADSGAISDWAWDAMAWAAGEGIFLGANGRLLPKDALTRAQAAAILQRFAASSADESIPIRTVKTDAFSMDYFSFGHGEKTLVILPGLSVQSVMASADAVAEAYQPLTDAFTIYVFDRRNELPATYSVSQMAQDTAEALETLGLEQVNLFGASQGGMMALEIAIHHPQLVRRLALGSTSAEITPEQFGTIDNWIGLAREKDAEGLYLAFGEALYPTEVFEQSRELLCALAATVTDEDLARFVILAEGMRGFSADDVEKISCPVLILGSSDDRVLGGDASKQIAQRLSGHTETELFLYDGYGHAVYDTAPDYKDRLSRFFLGE